MHRFTCFIKMSCFNALCFYLSVISHLSSLFALSICLSVYLYICLFHLGVSFPVRPGGISGQSLHHRQRRYHFPWPTLLKASSLPLFILYFSVCVCEAGQMVWFCEPWIILFCLSLYGWVGGCMFVVVKHREQILKWKPKMYSKMW